MNARSKNGLTTVRSALVALAAGILIAACGGAERGDPADASESEVGGLRLFLGVVPAALVRGHEAGSATQMHAAARQVSDSHHVMVAIYDIATGGRLSPVKVVATVRPGRGPSASRVLEPMTVNGSETFGNYFSLPDDGSRTVIEVEVTRASGAPITAEFHYRHVP